MIGQKENQYGKIIDSYEYWDLYEFEVKMNGKEFILRYWFDRETGVARSEAGFNPREEKYK